ncbi:MAG TPA: hypothetical protein VK888_06735 [Anaerolineales bacterium]|nr:hypothetical protein [Anaerolineales bacterium]
MSKLPSRLSLLVKIMLVDGLIALLVGAWSWIAGDFSQVALSNRSDWRQMLAQSAGQSGTSGWWQISFRSTLFHG